MNRITVVLLVLLFCLPSISMAYEVIEVKDGGSIEGVVRFAGNPVPQDKTLTISSDTQFCGESLPAEKYLINAERGIKNVVVFIKNIKAGKQIPSEPVVVDNQKCAFVPRVSIGFKRMKILIKNSDPMFHNVHTFIKGRTQFNLGLPKKGSKVTKRLRKTGVIEITCDAHPWMLGYTYILDHPYAAVTNEKGEFVINDIPPGTYNIEAWHEALGNVKIADVKVGAGKSSKIKLEYK